jgi:hypothetical protein
MFPWVNLGFPIEDLGSSTKNLGFPGKIWGSQRERTHAERSAHVPKVACPGPTKGLQAQGGASVRIRGMACSKEHARANRKAHKRG